MKNQIIFFCVFAWDFVSNNTKAKPVITTSGGYYQIKKFPQNWTLF